jgi:hypothetical protein
MANGRTSAEDSGCGVAGVLSLVARGELADFKVWARIFAQISRESIKDFHGTCREAAAAFVVCFPGVLAPTKLLGPLLSGEPVTLRARQPPLCR